MGLQISDRTKIYILATILHIVLEYFEIIKISIVSVMRSVENNDHSFLKNLQAAFANSQKENQTQLIRKLRRSNGKIVGILERQLYMFALMVEHFEIISAVLLFKAFQAWITSPSTTQDNEETKKQRDEAFTSYYSYAAANFTSLLLGIAIFGLGWSAHNQLKM